MRPPADTANPEYLDIYAYILSRAAGPSASEPKRSSRQGKRPPAKVLIPAREGAGILKGRQPLKL
mgnify:CR=1 FL=1